MTDPRLEPALAFVEALRTLRIIGHEGGEPPVSYLDWRPLGLYVRVGRWRLMLGPSFGCRPLVERVE